MQRDHHGTIAALVNAHATLRAKYDALGQTIRDLVPEADRIELTQRLQETSSVAEAMVTEIMSTMVSGETEWLGSVIRTASFVEHQLRATVAALLGSKYAAVAVAGQNTSSLIQLAGALVIVRDDVTEEHGADLKALLKRCEQALDKRSRFAHSIWGNAADGSSVTMTSKFRKWELLIQPVTTDDLAELQRELNIIGSELMTWTMTVLPGDASNEVQLRWEEYISRLSPADRAILIAGRAQQIVAQGSIAQPADAPSPGAEAQ